MKVAVEGTSVASDREPWLTNNIAILFLSRFLPKLVSQRIHLDELG